MKLFLGYNEKWFARCISCLMLHNKLSPNLMTWSSKYFFLSHGICGSGIKASKGFDQVFSWNFGFIWRLNWVRICLQVLSCGPGQGLIPHGLTDWGPSYCWLEAAFISLPCGTLHRVCATWHLASDDNEGDGSQGL